MGSTTNRTHSDAGRGVPGRTAPTGSAELRAAGQRLLTTTGNEIVKVAVDRAVHLVDRAAGRLDALAAQPPQPPGARTGRKPSERATATGGETARGSAPRARIGASFGFLVERAIQLWRLVERLARQLLAALARRLSRGDASAPDPATDEPPSAERKRPKGRAATSRGGRPPDDAAAVPGPARPPQPPRHRRGSAPGAPRRRGVAGEPRGRTGRDD